MYIIPDKTFCESLFTISQKVQALVNKLSPITS